MGTEKKISSRREVADTIRQRRDALIETAERVFLRKGYHAATMDDVAAAARMSKRTLYQLVQSKEELFTALLERRRHRLDISGVETAGRPVDAVLNEIIRCWAYHVLSPSITSLLRLIMADHIHGSTLSRLLDREGTKPCREALSDYFTACAAAGSLSVDDPDEASMMLYGMAIGNIHIEMLLGIRKAPAHAELDERIARAVRLFLDGASPGRTGGSVTGALVGETSAKG